MGQAAALGEVVLGIQRKMPMPDSLSPTSGIAGGGLGYEHKEELSPEMMGEYSGQIPQGMRDVVVERPNTQTSFGFVLQSNTLRAGCVICEFGDNSGSG